ncbi:hypothetical protein Nepgr_001889 [Nepenthes gracilis]|uniref:Aldehyde dehydrogenase n=1 Tax=Nepenthes gracilis TaxID=150966 RepID=A0AAD3RY35_NEPGR|nr:hypothetical protein Nepgr_001889 [Nepenthes gracilis]
MEEEMEQVRRYFSSGRTREASWRKSQLHGLHRFIGDREDDIFRALLRDLGKSPVESYRDELGILKKDINAALDNLADWMSGKKIKLPLVSFPTTAELVSEPLGLVLIISSWNFPFGLSLEPLIGAIAAGNTVVLKTSELAPASSDLLADAIPTYLDSKAIKVIQGGPDVAQSLLHLKWDKIFFTGSKQVGRIVMAAAAEHLTPVTLELGGKCPAIVDSLPTWDFTRDILLKRLVSGKFGSCSGQACVGVDYIIVQENFAPTLINLLKGITEEMFGKNPKESHAMTRIINAHHYKRLKNLLKEDGVEASVVYGGSMDEDALFIEPTILVDPPINSDIMTDEIFGPLLPIITMKRIEDSIKFINSRPKALAVYCFSTNDKFMRRVATETSSGSLLFNDTILQYAAETVPFGGVGESGFGRYHGKFSFDTFSHEKAVLRRTSLPDFWFRYPPWNDYKLELFRLFYVFDYLGIILTVLGLKKPRPRSTNV